MLDQQCNIRLNRCLLMQLQDCADFEQVSVSEYVRTKLAGVVARNLRKHKQTLKSEVLSTGDLYNA